MPVTAQKREFGMAQ